jgi:hypothetical protein
MGHYAENQRQLNKRQAQRGKQGGGTGEFKGWSYDENSNSWSPPN